MLAGARRLLFGDRVKHAHVSDHGAFMRGLGRAWAIPMTLVFSSGALITLGQKQITTLVGQYQHHQALDYVTLALLAITFVIVGGMDLTLLTSLRTLRERLAAPAYASDPQSDAASDADEANAPMSAELSPRSTGQAGTAATGGTAEQRHTSVSSFADQHLLNLPMERLDTNTAPTAGTDDESMPAGRYNDTRLNDRVAATR
jgi:hypothetical protein